MSLETRIFPGLGARLSAHPRLAGAILAALRSIPGRRIRGFAYLHVTRPLADRMSGRLVVSVPEGGRMVADLSDVMGRMLATSGVWEPHVTAVFRRLLSPEDVCVDVGAHVGYYTVLASRIVGPRGHVYAVEPAPWNYRELRANLSLNRASNVTVLPVAAGAADGHAQVYEGEPGSSGSSDVRAEPADGEDPSAGWTVAVRPIASVLSPTEVSKVRLVKIDVEGYEVHVLRGVEPIFELGGRPALLVELHGARAAEGARHLQHFCDRYRLRVYELVEGGGADRFSPPPPRELTSPLAPASVYSGRGCNLLLAP